MNTQSLNNKAAIFTDFICDYKPDIVAVTETWSHKNESAASTVHSDRLQSPWSPTIESSRWWHRVNIQRLSKCTSVFSRRISVIWIFRMANNIWNSSYSFSACWLLNLQLAGKPTNFIFLAGKFLVCLAGKKEQIIFSQHYWKKTWKCLNNIYFY